ncbi:MAG TPA: rRNA maturation RNase YbeY [Candidatus Binatia bacterium]|jgi:rRNA maturation RNase YbeY
MPVDIVQRGAGKRMPSRKIKKIALTILELLAQKNAELSLALIGNAEMRRLNARYRKKDYPTDVLSFPAGGITPKDAPLLGDVIISVDKAIEQATGRGHSSEQEVITLLIHGIVHLLGYDHERSMKEARAMGRVERRIYRQLCERGVIKV